MTPRDELLATVASLYYKLNQNQSQIATRLEMSASKVSRMLKEAHERGIVEIHIHLPIPRDFALEQDLIDTFGIKDAYVLQTTESSEHPVLIRSLGRLAASYVELIVSELADGQSIGASWSESVYATFEALSEKVARNISVVQLAGGVSAYGFDYANLSQSVAAKLGGRHYLLHAPCAVERPDMRDMLLQEPMIRDVIARAGQVALAICGIGTMSQENSFVRSGLLSWDEIQAIRAQGVVGEMCGTFYDLDGRYAQYDINQRTIGIALATLRTLPRVLAVARGVGKAAAIAGALRGGFVKVLATDDLTARAVLGIGK